MVCGLVISLNISAQNRESMDSFIDSLMKEMTIQEKIGQFNLITPGSGIPTGAVVSTNVEEKVRAGKVGALFGVSSPQRVRKAQALAVTKTRMKIPLMIGSDVIHGYKTTFPIPLAMSCSWDVEMVENSARIAATEASADGICWNFAPMADISRDARWGRVAEGFGEDPFLGSEFAKAMVRGYQGDDLTKSNTMLATVKHFALYGAPVAGRDYNTVDMSRLKMFNEYLPPYKAGIEAGAGCVMSAFNDVEGIPASGNRWLLTDLLRGHWGFDGFVVSDYTSITEMIAHGMGDRQTVAAMALRAGLDMEIVGESMTGTLQESLAEGLVTEEQINTACRRVLEAKYKLGLFDDPYRYVDDSRPEKEILTPENRRASRDAARKSFVLLKNNNNVLPLQKKGIIALIGPLANNKNNMLGTWAVAGDPQMSVPVLEGMKNVAGKKAEFLYAKGANISNDTAYAKKINVFGTRIDIDERSPEVMLNEALEVAEKSDVIVAVVGEASEMSGESSSRTNLLIPESQKKLIRALAETGKPLVLITMSGRPLAIGEELKLADAVLHTWHPGIEAGNAIADVVFGDYNPSGKLSMSFPRNVGQVPIHYRYRSTGRPAISEKFQKFQTNYLDVPNSPLLPFGYGLSYTTFEYGQMTVSDTTPGKSDKVEVRLTIRNAGERSGREVVQLYIRDLVCSITRPVKELKGFQIVDLEVGESKEVIFEISTEDLKFYSYPDMNNLGFPIFEWEAGEFEIMVGKNSEDVQSVRVNWSKE